MISIHKFYVFSFMHYQRLLSMHLHDALVEFKDKVKQTKLFVPKCMSSEAPVGI
jgi:hypothetical protein